jgi:RNA polymerase sigma factor (sigma-70 family)
MRADRPDGPTNAPLWAARLSGAVKGLRQADGGEREHARATLWRLLHAGLFACLRAQAGRTGHASAEDLEDLASQKALELLVRAEEGTWEPTGRPAHEVGGYVAQVARHALVDLARLRGREAPAPENPEAWDSIARHEQATPVRPEDVLAARDFALALQECVERLAPRAREAWFRRVFLERPSREIASALGLRADHVDVVVQRARATLRECMDGRGQRGAVPAPGVFVHMWRWLEARPPESGEEVEG